MTCKDISPEHPDSECRLLSCAETAAYLHVCQETVRRLKRANKLRAVPGLRKLLFTSEAINDFLRGEP
ncbi:MAG: helix-turn-helix domain-containing protein [Pseudorhodoplanes sp.]|nr:helix-turn-helix domain-containing protein [Pseudorhodoplanes sp.]